MWEDVGVSSADPLYRDRSQTTFARYVGGTGVFRGFHSWYCLGQSHSPQVDHPEIVQRFERSRYPGLHLLRDDETIHGQQRGAVVGLLEEQIYLVSKARPKTTGEISQLTSKTAKELQKKRRTCQNISMTHFW